VSIRTPFNVSIEMATTAKRGGKCHDLDALYRLWYAQFRVLMRAEQSSTASSDSEKTTPPSSFKNERIASELVYNFRAVYS
jgi:hypothetical protein